MQPHTFLVTCGQWLIRTIKMQSVCRIDFIDNQNRTDKISKFVLVYQNLKRKHYLLKPLKSLCASDVVNVLVDIFKVVGVPYLLICERDRLFSFQIVCHLFFLKIKTKIFCGNTQIYNHKNHAKFITRIVGGMIDTWLMLNDADKWIEGLNIIQFQMNHNIYHEAVHLPTSFNNSYSSNSKQCVTELKSKTKSVFGTNIQVKKINMNNALGKRIQTVIGNFQKKTKFNLKTETELSIISSNKIIGTYNNYSNNTISNI